jgi:hypothetical protein
MHTLRAIRHGERTVLADTVSSRRIYVDAHILPAHHAHVPFPMVRLDIGVTVFWLISIKLRENALAHKHSRRLVDMYIIRCTRLTTLTSRGSVRLGSRTDAINLGDPRFGMDLGCCFAFVTSTFALDGIDGATQDPPLFRL